jgi:hypothetical protein
MGRVVGHPARNTRLRHPAIGHGKESFADDQSEAVLIRVLIQVRAIEEHRPTEGEVRQSIALRARVHAAPLARCFILTVNLKTLLYGAPPLTGTYLRS